MMYRQYVAANNNQIQGNQIFYVSVAENSFAMEFFIFNYERDYAVIIKKETIFQIKWND